MFLDGISTLVVRLRWFVVNSPGLFRTFGRKQALITILLITGNDQSVKAFGRDSVLCLFVCVSFWEERRMR